MCVFCTLNSIVEAFSAKTPKPNSITKDFRVIDSKWGASQESGSSGGSVSYSFAESNFNDQFEEFDSFILDTSYQREIRGSLSAWENVADIRFVFSEDSRNTDIRFGWRDIDGQGGILGQTFVPSFGPLSQVVVAFDINEDWFVGGDSPPNQIDFSSTATHEIGHAIGIDHSDKPDALMNANYSRTIFDLQQDDIDAATHIYGANELDRVDVFRFFNPNLGGHLFTADISEKNALENNEIFNVEGIGFSAISKIEPTTTMDTVPVYRFFNAELGSHLFTAFELEKDHLLNLSNYTLEGIGFRAFQTNTSSTTPVYRFFDVEKGGHFFTANEIEMDAVMNMPQFRYEGEAFYAYA